MTTHLDETLGVAELIRPSDPTVTERELREAFARQHAALEYRDMLDGRYAAWHRLNADHFGSTLRVPHIGIGRVAPRRFSQCRLTTDYGGAIDITISEAIAFGTNRQVVRAGYPAEGLVRFLNDLLLGETVRQQCLESLGADEASFGGYGPRYAAEATRIGVALGLPEVVHRRRGHRGNVLPVAAFWPWAFRPDGYYLGHVRLEHRAVAGLRQRPPERLAAVPGIYEYFLYLLVTGRSDRLQAILGREVDEGRVALSPALGAAERQPLDAAGQPLPLPVIDPTWLAWNFRCVPLLATAVRERRAFDIMPILADALEDAGCSDSVLLDHCRLAATHTASCWAIRLLLNDPG